MRKILIAPVILLCACGTSSDELRYRSSVPYDTVSCADLTAHMAELKARYPVRPADATETRPLGALVGMSDLGLGVDRATLEAYGRIDAMQDSYNRRCGQKKK
jgi:hypothetical protein